MFNKIKNVASILATGVFVAIFKPESALDFCKMTYDLIKDRGLDFEYVPPEDYESQNVKKGICILGPEKVGKTSLYNFLKSENSSGQTTVHEYKEFVYNIDKNKSIIIRKGIDIGGGTEYIHRYYEKMINDKKIDYCFFVFNAFKYLKDEDDEYQRHVRARLQFIFNKNILDKKAIIIGSHIDLFDADEKAEIAKKIKESTSDKSYSTLLTNEYLHLLNLNNEIALKTFFELIFTP